MKHYAGIDVSLNSCSVCAVVEAPSLRNCSLVQKECLAPEVVRTRGKLSAADGDVQNRYVEFPIKSQLQRDLQLRCRSDDFTFHRLKGNSSIRSAIRVSPSTTSTRQPATSKARSMLCLRGAT